MRRLLAVFTVLILVVASSPAAAQDELLINGDFETGNFTGWTQSWEGVFAWCTNGWQVAASYDCPLEPVSPAGGNFMALNSMDGQGEGADPLTFTMYQDVDIPAASTAAELTFVYRLQWYNYDTWLLPRTMEVQIRDVGTDAILARPYFVSTGNPAPRLFHIDTNWIPVTIDMTAYAGQEVRVAVFESVPEDYTGGSMIYFDNFSLTAYTGGNLPIEITEDDGNTTVIEGGLTDVITFTLPQAPTDEVTFSIAHDTQCSLSANTVTLDATNWNIGFDVTVTATNDAVIDGTHLCQVTTGAASSTDPTYNTVNTPNIVVNVLDDDGVPTQYTTCPPAPAYVNQVYEYTLNATGSPNIVYDHDGQSLPTGITLNAETGVLSGTPPSSSDSPTLIMIHAENGAVPFDFLAFPQVAIDDAPGAPYFMDYPPMPTIQGEWYCHRPYTRGNPFPTDWTLGGTLPAGLSFNTSDGTITGIPTESGLFNFSISVSNANGSDQRFYSLRVYPPRTLGTITSSPPPYGMMGQAYSHTFTGAGSPPPSFNLFGELPPGLTYNGTTISGTPTQSGVYRLTAFARTTVNDIDGQDILLTIYDPADSPTITSGAPVSGTVGTSYTHTFTATGSPPATFTLDGELPAGLLFNGTSIVGTPLVAGTFGPFTLTASNGIPDDVTQNFNLSIDSTVTDVPLLNPIAADAPLLTWSGITWAAGYEIEISESPSMTPLLLTVPVSGNATTSQLISDLTPYGDGIYYWRVRGVNGAVVGQWSAVQMFVLDVAE